MAEKVQQRWMQLGIVGKAHGLNGAFFISQRDELLPETVKILRVGPDAETAKPLTIKGHRWQNDRPLLLCAEIQNRNAAEALTHQILWADRAHLEIDDDDEYFWGDLVGKKLIDAEGQAFGEILEVNNYGASDVVLVKNGKGQTTEIPFVELYFDMEFDWDDEVLKLVVPSSVFDETWSDA